MLKIASTSFPIHVPDSGSHERGAAVKWEGKGKDKGKGEVNAKARVKIPV